MATEARSQLHYEARTSGRFVLETLGATLLLAATTIAAHRLPLQTGTTIYTVVQLLPILPVWLLPLVMYRHYRRIDELQRLQFLQAVGITAGTLVGAIWSWPSLQRAFQLQMPPGMWEVHFSIVFALATMFISYRSTRPRAG